MTFVEFSKFWQGDDIASCKNVLSELFKRGPVWQDGHGLTSVVAAKVGLLASRLDLPSYTVLIFGGIAHTCLTVTTSLVRIFACVHTFFR